MTALRKRKWSRDERVAYHEAGHAVAAVELRFPFIKVTIKPGEDFLGKVQLKEPFRNIRFDGSLAMRERIEKYAMWAMAGAAAEWKLTGRFPWRYGASGDLKNVENVFGQFHWDNHVVTKYLHFVVARAKAMFAFPPTWYATKLLAQALIKEREIDGPRARRLIRHAIDDPKAYPRKVTHL